MYSASRFYLFFCFFFVPTITHCSLSTQHTKYPKHVLTQAEQECLARLKEDSSDEESGYKTSSVYTPETDDSSLELENESPLVFLAYETVDKHKAYIKSFLPKKQIETDESSDFSSEESSEKSTESTFTTELKNKLLIAAKQRHKAKSLSLPTITITPPTERTYSSSSSPEQVYNFLNTSHRRIPTDERERQKKQKTFSNENKPSKKKYPQTSPDVKRRCNAAQQQCKDIED